MRSMDEFSQKEQTQSHSFVFFDQGPPYCELGWKDYKHFNHLIADSLRQFKEAHGVDVWVYEHEIIDIEAAFLWGFSFFETDAKKRDELSDQLRQKISTIMEGFSQLKDRPIINNHDAGFCIHPALGMHYSALIFEAEIELDTSYNPPKEKSYKKEDLDLSRLNGGITVAEFKKLIQEQTSIRSANDIEHLHALDGFFSNKYRPNKYLREEFIPITHFLRDRQISDSSTIHLGVQQENFDVKISNTESGQETIVEITLACPKNDYLLHSIMSKSGLETLPLKTMAYLKKEKDSLPERIVKAIEDKHKKNYKDQRLLMVVVQPEYTYQAVEYILDEIIEEVRGSVTAKKGTFQEIIMLCNGRFYHLF